MKSFSAYHLHIYVLVALWILDYEFSSYLCFIGILDIELRKQFLFFLGIPFIAHEDLYMHFFCIYIPNFSNNWVSNPLFFDQAGLALGDLKSVKDLYDFKTLTVLFFIGSLCVLPTLLKRKRTFEWRFCIQEFVLILILQLWVIRGSTVYWNER